MTCSGSSMAIQANMVVSLNRVPTHCNPYYGDPQNGTSDFGKLPCAAAPRQRCSCSCSVAGEGLYKERNF